jgi:hypothetical protein
MRTPTCILLDGVLTIRDSHGGPLLPLALAAVGGMIVWANPGRPAALAIAAAMIVVAVLGFLRSAVTIDREQRAVIVSRHIFGIGRSIRYDLHCVKGVAVKWSRYGDRLVMTIADQRKTRDVRIAGPTRADLSPMVQEVRRYLARS